jgi:hypothetical protein
MTYNWRVWLHGERDARSVSTKLDVPLHAVAAAMDQAGRGVKQQVRADRLELLDADGKIEQVWRHGRG